MAVGPFARILAQVVVPVIAIMARALPAAYAAAVQNAKKNGAGAAKDASKAFGRARISRDEALQVLNIAEAEATPEAIQRQYDKYFAANAVENGGSFYLQSKVYRAKELLDEFEKEKRDELKKEKEQQDAAAQNKAEEDDSQKSNDKQ